MIALARYHTNSLLLSIHAEPTLQVGNFSQMGQHMRGFQRVQKRNRVSAFQGDSLTRVQIDGGAYHMRLKSGVRKGSNSPASISKTTYLT